MYEPSEELLNKYADVLINFALNGGEGVKKGEVVLLMIPEVAKPLLISLRRAVLKSGAHPLIHYMPDDMAREVYDLSSDEQLDFFPEKMLRGRVDQVDHSVSIIADTDMKELEGVDPVKIMRKSKAFKPYMDWRREKEARGEFSWTLALYGTEAMAKEAGLNLEEYWAEIEKACFLDLEDPITKWKEVASEVERVKEKLDSLRIDKLHVEGENIDLWVGLGENRKWLGGSGRNIPSFEVFISPDCRRTSGRIKFNKPLYRYGNLIEDIYLEFKDGKVVDSGASKNEQFLKEMIATEGADMVGEFSLTDARISRITKFMATTLFDENVGGEFGNSHIALGMAYKDSFPGDASKVIEEQWEEMGYNNSVVHTDIVNTEKKKVTAYFGDGEERIIYENGRFLV